MRKRYLSDLTDAQWARITPIFESSGRGRPRKVGAREDVNAARNHARRAGEAAGRSGRDAVGRRSRVKVLQDLVEHFTTAKRLANLQRQVAADPSLLEPKRRHSSPGLYSMLSNPYFRTVLAPLRAQVASS